jgi:hypothetical protein
MALWPFGFAAYGLLCLLASLPTGLFVAFWLSADLLSAFDVFELSFQEEGSAPLGTGRACFPPKGERGGGRSFGQLVRLGCDIAVYTPASYQRHRL